MTLPSSGALGMAAIQTEFGRGNNLNAYRGTSWYTDTPSSGTFSAGTIYFSEFYGKRLSNPVTPGSQTFYSSGTHTIVIHNTLTIQVWGGGAGGQDPARVSPYNGTAGGNSSWNSSVFGNGGSAATNGGTGGVGGTASGGSTNTTGGTGGTGGTGAGNTGAGAGGGGAGGTSITSGNTAGRPGSVPGGGGSGGRYQSRTTLNRGGGGGGGGYSSIAYSAGTFGVGSGVSVTVGGGGTGGNSGGPEVGGAGAGGQVTISWA